MLKAIRAIYKLLCLVNDVMSIINGSISRRYKNKIIGKTVRKIYK